MYDITENYFYSSKEIEIKFEMLTNMLNQAKLEGWKHISIKVLEEIIK